jgi:hypothetical protein
MWKIVTECEFISEYYIMNCMINRIFYFFFFFFDMPTQGKEETLQKKGRISDFSNVSNLTHYHLVTCQI